MKKKIGKPTIGPSMSLIAFRAAQEASNPPLLSLDTNFRRFIAGLVVPVSAYLLGGIHLPCAPALAPGLQLYACAPPMWHPPHTHEEHGSTANGSGSYTLVSTATGNVSLSSTSSYILPR